MKEKTIDCPKCGFHQSEYNLDCIRCGVVFDKYQKARNGPPGHTGSAVAAFEKPQSRGGGTVGGLLCPAGPESKPLVLAGRVLLFLVIVLWGAKFIFTPLEANHTGESFWHLVNLPFHEAGHVVFRPFSEFFAALGGSLGQLLMPLVCLVVFLGKTKDTFAASFSLWWLGENFMDLAPYINDARSLTLPLLGGNTGMTSPYGFHDWEFILQELGLIQYDHIIARFSYGFETLLMIVALFWGGLILFMQFQNIKLRR